MKKHENCIITGCDRKRVARGLCLTHNQYVRYLISSGKITEQEAVNKKIILVKQSRTNADLVDKMLEK